MCHEEKNTKKYIHYPVQEGECTICHSHHSAANKFLLSDSIISNLCFECHDLVLGENDLTHKPVKDGNCQYCQDPHQSDFSLMKKAKIPDLCVNCHETVKQQLTLKRIHPPFEEECLLCHNPHSSKEKRLLVQTSPDLCFNCHDDFRISGKKSLLIHKPVEDERSCLNCHSPHASSEYRFLLKKEKQLCLSCHNVHASNNEHLIAIKVKFGNWEMPLKYTVNENGGSCLPGCHEKREYER